MTDATEELEREVAGFVSDLGRLRDEIHKIIVGQDELIDQVLIGLLVGRHVLLEGVPGLGKTLLVRTLARAVHLDFGRIQFTPDLMPADITGTNIMVEDQRGHRSFEFQRGPIFANVVLADEVNRATPKTQSALLEAMQEATVTVIGRQHELPRPFFVLATQNPIEMEGTYPLPEAQLDRFLFKLRVEFPDKQTLLEVFEQTTGAHDPDIEPILDAGRILRMQELSRSIMIALPLAEYVAGVVLATHPDSDSAPGDVKRFVRFGASPRGGQAMILAAKARALMQGRRNVSGEDLRAVAKPALRHRLILNFEGEAEGMTTDDVLDAVLASVKP